MLVRQAEKEHKEAAFNLKSKTLLIYFYLFIWCKKFRYVHTSLSLSLYIYIYTHSLLMLTGSLTLPAGHLFFFKLWGCGTCVILTRMQNGHVIYCTGMWLRAYWLSTRKWITVSERINCGQATHYKRATIHMDWATSSVMISLFEPVLHHSDRKKKKTQKSPNTEKPDVTSTAMLGTIKPDGMIK